MKIYNILKCKLTKFFACNGWDKKRLIAEIVVAILCVFLGNEIGSSKNYFVHNGNIINNNSYENTLNDLEKVKEENNDLQNSMLGADIANYALRFLDLKYVFGGNNITEGVDSSGLIQSIYQNFNIKLPRRIRDIAHEGISITLSSVKPGDLIFYGTDSNVNHVAIYIGDDTIIHASNPKVGVVLSKIDYRRPSMARRVINYK